MCIRDSINAEYMGQQQQQQSQSLAKENKTSNNNEDEPRQVRSSTVQPIQQSSPNKKQNLFDQIQKIQEEHMKIKEQFEKKQSILKKSQSIKQLNSGYKRDSDENNILFKISDEQGEIASNIGILPKQDIDKSIKIILRQKQKQINYLQNSNKPNYIEQFYKPTFERIKQEILKSKERYPNLNLKTLTNAEQYQQQQALQQQQKLPVKFLTKKIYDYNLGNAQQELQEYLQQQPLNKEGIKDSKRYNNESLQDEEIIVEKKEDIQNLSKKLYIQ
eukprot:TRINITY_DN1689_c0_g1_i2.p1 TRINITY_DN1689_c0_g1~~TRINITY_DN1689_c0_g1_i2.p1  ORF type:complete len:274 (+),score=63.88 TRINITY_DN1689_c0_g1_i2:191-1012(+)